MNINLEKVELENIRSHKEMDFTPEKEGITAISGPNGTGKSTIVDSIAWALYGVKPQFVPKNIDLVRKGADISIDPVHVRVHFSVDSSKFLVERRIVNKQGKVECDLWQIEDGEKNRLAGSAVTHVEPEIRKVLGLNSQGFLSAVLVQQKQVDQLITATPKERTKVIERLTGIDSISIGYQKSRDEYNRLRRDLEKTPIVESSDSLVKEKKDIEKNINDLVAKIKSLKTQVKNSNDESKDLLAKLEEAKEARDEETSLRERISKDSTIIDELKPVLQEAIEDKDSLKSQLGNYRGENFENLSEKLRKAEEVLAGKRAEQSSLKQRLSTLKESELSSESLIENSKVEDIEEARKQLKKLEKEHSKVEKAFVHSRESSAAAHSTVKRLERAIEVLTEGECPTCLQTVENADKAVVELRSEIDEYKVDDKRDYKEEMSTLQSEIERYKSIVSAFENLESIKENREALLISLPTLAADVKVKEKTVFSLRKRYNLASQNKDRLDRYKRVSDRAVKITKRRNEIMGRVNQNSELLKKLDTVTDSQYNSLVKKEREVRDQVQKGLVEISTVKGERNLLQERAKNLEKEIESIKSAEKEYKTLLQSVEIALSNSLLIEEFRTERINTVIPLIEGYASDLINRFTDGMFSGIKLDSKFNTSVVLADGSIRPFGMLSGGELSAAAIALRLSISMLLNAEAGNGLIILDEVFVSQDSGRATQILNTISEVADGQIIIIAHNDLIDGIADKVVQL